MFLSFDGGSSAKRANRAATKAATAVARQTGAKFSSINASNQEPRKGSDRLKRNLGVSELPKVKLPK